MDKTHYIVYNYNSSLDMVVLPLLISAVGHACWDNVLYEIYIMQCICNTHMIWLHLTLMSVCLFILSFKSPEPQKRTLSWWLRFALAGYQYRAWRTLYPFFGLVIVFLCHFNLLFLCLLPCEQKHPCPWRDLVH